MLLRIKKYFESYILKKMKLCIKPEKNRKRIHFQDEILVFLKHSDLYLRKEESKKYISFKKGYLLEKK